MKLKVVVRFVSVGVALAGLFSSCSTPGSSYTNAPPSPPSPISPDSGTVLPASAPKASSGQRSVQKERTGIATGWGREVTSSLGYTYFQRATTKPRYVSSIRYNDRSGASEMGVNRATKEKGIQPTAGGLVEWGMASSWGALDNYWWRGGRFVIGKKGREYQLQIKNRSEVRLEVVLSVDGLDVIDGEAASTKKRGYIIGPGKTLKVKGFRTSHERVATFKFSTVGASYANLRSGDTRNVGIVGLAVFTEKGRRPGTEMKVRQNARPFAEAPQVRARD